jgi:hypothetical protein
MKKVLVMFAAVAAVLLFSHGMAAPRPVHAIPADNGRYAIYPLAAPVGGVLLDTQTGRVWQITEVTDQKGNGIGKVALDPVPFLNAPSDEVTRPH